MGAAQGTEATGRTAEETAEAMEDMVGMVEVALAGTEATVSRMVVAMAVAVADMATIAEGTIMARIEAVGDAAVGGR